MSTVETKKKAGRPKKEVKEPVSESTNAVEEKKILVDAAELERLKGFESIVREAEAQTAAAQIKKTDYSYFGEFEKGSSVPARDLPRNVEMLSDEVNKLGSMLENNQIPLEEIEYQKADYEKKKKRLEQIKSSKPKLTGLQMDRLVQKRNALADEIRKSKFTTLQMEKGLADPHEEARRMSEPCVPFDKEEAARMGIPITPNGYVTRSVAENAWKMMSSLIGDTSPNPNTEVLRSDTGFRKKIGVPVDVDIVDGKVIY